jgi:hypothetical protein
LSEKLAFLNAVTVKKDILEIDVKNVQLASLDVHMNVEANVTSVFVITTTT